jgi:4-diphosphocytidyl-2-C-methyl-D-erythritol kinase
LLPLQGRLSGPFRVSATLSERAPAKINLTLRVLGRRADGYHVLESLVAFADLSDTLTLLPADDTALAIAGPFAGACGPLADNLVLKAAAALRARVGALKSGRFLLHKHIPVAGGIGGGSADAGAALRLLARANDLALDDPRLGAVALAVGADVPVCLDPRARVMSGVGEVLSAPVELPPLDALLVNPGVPLATREVFAAFAGGEGGKTKLGPLPAQRDALIDYLARQDNDLTQAAVACAPPVAEVLAALHAAAGSRLTRMSGSGPTCFALFVSPGEAAAAARKLAAAHPDWWVRATVIA